MQFAKAPTFRTQRPNETVLLVTRRHWWSWVRWLPIPILLMIGLWVLSALVPVLSAIFVMLSLVMMSAITFYLYLEWMNDSVIITNERIIRLHNNLLRFSERVDDTHLSSIQEINAEIPPFDLFGWVFGYGYVEIKTAGDAGNVMLTMIPDPEGVQDVILRDYNAFRDQYQTELPPANAWGKPSEKLTTDLQVKPVSRPPFSPFVSHFETNKGEIIFRKHWMTWVQGVFLPIVGMLGALVAFALTLFTGVGIVGWGSAGMAFLACGLWFYWSDWDWRNDYIVVNNLTLTIIHKRPLWLQDVKEQVLLRQVDNIGAGMEGIINRLLKKGDIQVSLIGGNEPKYFKGIENPMWVQNEIMRRQSLSKQQQQKRTPYGNIEQSGQSQHVPSRPPFGQSQPTAKPYLSEGRPYQPSQRPPTFPNPYGNAQPPVYQPPQQQPVYQPPQLTAYQHPQPPQLTAYQPPQPVTYQPPQPTAYQPPQPTAYQPPQPPATLPPTTGQASPFKQGVNQPPPPPRFQSKK